MIDIKRCLKMDLPEGQSAFLWGPRKAGKTTYLREKFPDSLFYDFLKTDVFLEFTKKPSLLREQLLAKDGPVVARPVVLDEVQKVPRILDEVHWLIENKKMSFIMCGSSARKLKRGQANLLGGRAWRYEMFPFVSAEIKDLNLLRAMNQGMIPAHYLQGEKQCRKSLKAYIQDYLKEEVFNEGLTRNIPAFSRFFDAIAYSHGEITNYVNIARECAVDSKTVKGYYQILVDTLSGTMVEPFKKRQHRQVISKAPKFYLFDVGIAGSLMNRRLETEKGDQFGKAFEHFIFMEINAYRGYSEKDFKINFWRTKSGLEVDFILGDGEVAIEVKGAQSLDRKDLRGIRAFVEEYTPKKAIVVSNEREARLQGSIQMVPWRKFLGDLWAGKVL